MCMEIFTNFTENVAYSKNEELYALRVNYSMFLTLEPR